MPPDPTRGFPVIEGQGGLSMVNLSLEDGSTAKVYLHGAHVTSWRPAGGQEVLFLSAASEFRPGAAIRGGVPVIFPQFAGQGPLPKHGFARNLGWELVSARSESPYQADARLALHVSKRTLSIWPRRFELELAVHLRPGSLEITLRVQNTDRQPWDFTGALHSYFRVSDVRETRIAGLGGVEYIESTNDRTQKRQSEPEIIFGGEVDRIYMNAPGQVDIIDSPRRIFVTSENFPDWVIWNPGPDKGQALSDLEPDGTLRFVCAEAAAASRPVTLQPGEHWQGSTRFSLSPAPAP